MSKSTKISVVIPTYNRCDTLKRALTSVYMQTCLAYEVIVIDDGSTDATAAMIQDEFPDIRYYTQENRGVSAARNKGINEANGEWLAFLDSDDEWLPEKIACQLATLKMQPELKICHTEEIWIRNGRRVNAMNKHAKRGGWIFEHCLPLCAMSPSSILIHHSVLADVGLFDESLPACEDYDLWLRIAANYPVAFVEQPQIKKFGGHDDQLSRKFWGMDRFRIRALCNIIDHYDLTPDNRRAARAMLIKKAEIYLAGCRKRRKHDQVQAYEALIDHYQNDS